LLLDLYQGQINGLVLFSSIFRHGIVPRLSKIRSLSFTTLIGGLGVFNEEILISRLRSAAPGLSRTAYSVMSRRRASSAMITCAD
jgi:hypothetical protein